MPKVEVSQELAVFGESGSGKTVLASSFYGRATDPDVNFAEEYAVTCTDASVRTVLHSNYLGMREDARAPRRDTFKAVKYPFRITLTAPDIVPVKERKKIDLVWHDYPGEWFGKSTSGETEERRRIETFRSLLQSDVALLLVDGDRLRSYAGEEERYLKHLVTNFRTSIQDLEEEILADAKKLVNFPRIWVFALTKADLLPDLTASAFRDLLVRKVPAEINELRSALGTFVQGNAVSLGEDFLILSSAEFTPGEVDTTKSVGLDVLVPLATLLPIERFAKWHELQILPIAKAAAAGNAFTTLAEIAPGLMQKAVSIVGRWAPVKIPRVAEAALAAEAVNLASHGVGQLKKLEAEALEKKSYTRAAFIGMQKTLAEAEERGILVRASE